MGEDINSYAHRAYLVKSLEGDLWLVRKSIGFPDDDNDDEDSNLPSGAREFEVYLQSGKLIEMLRLDSLGDNVLFVCNSDSISLSASYFGNYLQKDSIYHPNDFYEEAPDPYPNGPFDMKIFNVKDGSFSEHCPFQTRFRRMPPSIWVIPP
ncbi:cyclin F-box [Trifolium medium]|uniref:Cyclin F-box n=1 Tax=Trifolium medium TaxID=97028 RepID=A0A392Q497_9FABA|nr:cyclin F-box [Trifolium medium]